MNILSINTYRIDTFSPTFIDKSNREKIEQIIQQIKEGKKYLVSTIDSMGASSYLITFIFDCNIHKKYVKEIVEHDSIINSIAYEIRNICDKKQTEAIIQSAIYEIERSDPMSKKLLMEKSVVINNKNIKYLVVINRLPKMYDVFSHMCAQYMKDAFESHVFETLFEFDEHKQHELLKKDYDIRHMREILSKTHKQPLRNIVVLSNIQEFTLTEAKIFMFYSDKQNKHKYRYAIDLLSKNKDIYEVNENIYDENIDYRHSYYNDLLNYHVSTIISTYSTTYAVHIASDNDADDSTIKSMLNILISIISIQDIITNTFTNLYNCSYICVFDNMRKQKYAIYVTPIHSTYSHIYVSRANLVLQNQYNKTINNNKRS